MVKRYEIGECITATWLYVGDGIACDTTTGEIGWVSAGSADPSLGPISADVLASRPADGGGSRVQWRAWGRLVRALVAPQLMPTFKILGEE